MSIPNLRSAVRAVQTWGSMTKRYVVEEYQKKQFRDSMKKAGMPTFPQANVVLNRPYAFVLSTGRCGTGLITQILSASPVLRVEHMPQPELEYASSIAHQMHPSVQCLELAILSARFDLFFLNTYLRGKIYVETNPRMSFFAPALARLLPNAKFIHLVRNPADFVRSGMRRQYYETGVIYHQRLSDSGNDRWEKMTRLEKVAWEWNEINGRIEEFKRSCDSNRVLTLLSENLYSKEDTTNQLWKFLQLDNPFAGASGSARLRKLLANPVNKQRSGTFPKYNEWDAIQKQQLWRTASIAREYGYTPEQYR